MHTAQPPGIIINTRREKEFFKKRSSSNSSRKSRYKLKCKCGSLIIFFLMILMPLKCRFKCRFTHTHLGMCILCVCVCVLPFLWESQNALICEFKIMKFQCSRKQYRRQGREAQSERELNPIYVSHLAGV
jgi:hypothetical protein